METESNVTRRTYKESGAIKRIPFPATKDGLAPHALDAKQSRLMHYNAREENHVSKKRNNIYTR